MFLHIGDSKIVFIKELIGIFDYKIAAPLNPGFLRHNRDEVTQNNKRRKNENPKSFILTNDALLISPIAPLTLAGRRSKNSGQGF